MGSTFSCAAVAISSAIAAAAVLKAQDGTDDFERWFDEHERRYPHLVVRSPPTKE
jgi:hypothetical protein